ncbi:unnamed protein product, partial [Didymodactylos carnosus]
MAWGQDAPSYTTVQRWVQYFKTGGECLEDEQRPGRSITATSDENILKVKAVIESDPYATHDQIEEETLLSHGTINAILHEHLKLRKITSRWVPHLLTEKNKQD